MARIVQFLLFFCLFSQSAQGQTFDAPKLGKVDSQVRIRIVGKVNDLKIECRPANEDWFATKALDDSIVILFYPKEIKTYHFILADNLMNKTILQFTTIKITKDGKDTPDTPDVPVPVPVVKGPYTDRLSPFYLTAPNDAAKKELADIFDAMASNVKIFTTYLQAQTKLKEYSDKEFLHNELQPLRDEMTKVLKEQLGTTDGPIDQVKFTRTFTDLASSVRGIK